MIASPNEKETPSLRLLLGPCDTTPLPFSWNRKGHHRTHIVQYVYIMLLYTVRNEPLYNNAVDNLGHSLWHLLRFKFPSSHWAPKIDYRSRLYNHIVRPTTRKLRDPLSRDRREEDVRLPIHIVTEWDDIRTVGLRVVLQIYNIEWL